MREEFTIIDPPFSIKDATEFEQIITREVSVFTAKDAEWLLDDAGCEISKQLIDDRKPLGLSAILSADSVSLDGIAISSWSRCVYVTAPELGPEGVNSINTLSSKILLADSNVLLVGFEFASLSIRLGHWKTHVVGIDISSLDSELPKSPVEVCQIFGKDRFPSLRSLFQHSWPKNNPDQTYVYASLRAFLALACALHPDLRSKVELAADIDTRRVNNEQVDFFNKAGRIHDRLEALKPLFTKGDFVLVKVKDGSNEIELENAKYSSKLRVDHLQTIRLVGEDGAKVKAKVDSSRGRFTQTTSSEEINQIKEIEVLGRASGNASDVLWQAYLRKALQGDTSPHASPINTRILWYHSKGQRHQIRSIVKPLDSITNASMKLNPSQKIAHDAIISPFDAKLGFNVVEIVAGPPGTGKTATIAASVESWIIANPNGGVIYCCCASNVAAKNIGIALSKIQLDFRLIVSAEFHIGWHEELYGGLGNKLVISNELKARLRPQEVSKIMGNVRVVVSTLSMLSNPNLVQNGLFELYKMSLILVDEASQLRIDQYPHVFDRFRKSLKRAVFFGDDKQLPPYQSNTVKEIQSVFELPHLRKDALFLDTQYRMPEYLASFISINMYKGQLKSGPLTSKSTDCIKFVHCSSSESQSGFSFVNEIEINTILALVKNYYSSKEFRILTPYDAQRNLIELKLKAAALPWEDRVFNIDSYQGMESDIILVSLVRSKAAGFLNSLRRSNVMLTRCKHAMILVTNRNFVETIATNTLIGKLSKYVGPKHWMDDSTVLNGTATLPSS